MGNEFIGNENVFYKPESSLTKLKIEPKNSGLGSMEIFHYRVWMGQG